MKRRCVCSDSAPSWIFGKSKRRWVKSFFSHLRRCRHATSTRAFLVSRFCHSLRGFEFIEMEADAFRLNPLSSEVNLQTVTGSNKDRGQGLASVSQLLNCSNGVWVSGRCRESRRHAIRSGTNIFSGIPRRTSLVLSTSSSRSSSFFSAVHINTSQTTGRHRWRWPAATHGRGGLSLVPRQL